LYPAILPLDANTNDMMNLIVMKMLATESCNPDVGCEYEPVCLIMMLVPMIGVIIFWLPT